MKRSISSRLICANLLILAMALTGFFTFSTYVLRQQAYDSGAQEQKNNGRVPLQNAYGSDVGREFGLGVGRASNHDPIEHIFYDFHADGSVHFVTTGGLATALERDETHSLDISTISMEEPERIIIRGTEYLAINTDYVSAFSQSPNFEAAKEHQYEDLHVLSLLPYSEISTITADTVPLFVGLLLLLVGVSFVLIRWQARRITGAVETLSTVSTRYAARDFSQPITLTTGDELETLSRNIQSMVQSLIQYERGQVALFRNLSHELKTPLTAISGYAEGLEQGYFLDATEPLRIIQEESMRMRSILEDLILLSKLKSDAELFSFAPCDSSALLTKAVEKVESIAILRGIDICYTPTPGMIVEADSEKLLRAFLNILSNALKHATQSISIVHECRERDILITVFDDGPGFSKAFLEELFVDRFRETTDGSGIGLTIVKEIVARHNGTLSACNRPEGGARVAIAIPTSCLCD